MRQAMIAEAGAYGYGTAARKEKRRPGFSPDHRFKLRSEMRADLYAIQLSRQVARNFHTGLRLLNRRLAPLTLSGLLRKLGPSFGPSQSNVLQAGPAARAQRFEYPRSS